VHAADAMTADVAAKVALVLGSGAATAYLLKRDLSALLTATDGREMVVGDFPRSRGRAPCLVPLRLTRTPSHQIAWW
jgi:thiamine biosynthesis lipoprotein ApbE